MSPPAVPPSLSPYNISLSNYLTQNPTHSFLATGTLVFTASTSTNNPKILLLQRAPHDSSPHLWEIPGGALDPNDATILHGAARELWEEAGLVAKSFKSFAGDALWRFKENGGLCRKLTFLVDVEDDGGDLKVRIDEGEHQRFVWASEEECRRKKVGDLKIEFTFLAQEEMILEGFRVWKEEKEKEKKG